MSEALKRHSLQQLELRLRAHADWQGQDHVFLGLKNGLLNPRYILKLFDNLHWDTRVPTHVLSRLEAQCCDTVAEYRGASLGGAGDSGPQ